MSSERTEKAGGAREAGVGGWGGQSVMCQCSSCVLPATDGDDFNVLHYLHYHRPSEREKD